MRHPALTWFALAPLLLGFKPLESRNREVEQGNAALQAGKAEEALAHYDKAAAKLPADPGLHLDRGAALYALSRFEEAGKEFLRATEGGQDPSLKATAFRDLGNALSRQDKHKEAIEAYKRALALRPDDKAAKWNLEIALRKKKEEEKKQQDEKDKNKDKKDENKKDEGKEDKKDQQDKDKDKQDEKDKKKEANKDKDENKKEQDKQEKQPQPEKAAENQPERIQQMLKNLEANPKDLEKERARLRAIRRGPVPRDW